MRATAGSSSRLPLLSWPSLCARPGGAGRRGHPDPLCLCNQCRPMRNPPHPAQCQCHEGALSIALSPMLSFCAYCNPALSSRQSLGVALPCLPVHPQAVSSRRRRSCVPFSLLPPCTRAFRTEKAASSIDKKESVRGYSQGEAARGGSIRQRRIPCRLPALCPLAGWLAG